MINGRGSKLIALYWQLCVSYLRLHRTEIGGVRERVAVCVGGRGGDRFAKERGKVE